MTTPIDTMQTARLQADILFEQRMAQLVRTRTGRF